MRISPKELDDEAHAEEGDCHFTPRTPHRILRRIGTRGELLGDSSEAKRLALHRHSREKDEETKQLIVGGIMQTRFSKMLDGKGLDAIVDTMEPFVFEPGESILEQGDDGKYVFVAESGILHVIVDGNLSNEYGPGSVFGELAMIYNCPRTATVVANTAASVWGGNGDVFRKVLEEQMRQERTEHRHFIDRTGLFEGLSAIDKDRVGELIVPRSFEAGARVIREGDVPTSVYFVKAGQLSFVAGGKVDKWGSLVDGTVTGKLRNGDCFGWRAVQYGETESSSVVVDRKCELLCIGVPQLKELLGDDLPARLMQAFILTVLRQQPIMAQILFSQQESIAGSMEVTVNEAGTQVKGHFYLLIVVDGEVTGARDGEPVVLNRGQWFEDDALVQLEREIYRRQDDVPNHNAALKDLTAGPRGCRLATLSGANLASALRAVGLPADTPKQALEYVRKVLLTRKVPIFRELSEEQVNGIVRSFTLRWFAQGERVVLQGELSPEAFVIASGMVQVFVDGALTCSLGPGASFGERGLVLEEPRAATVQVCSEAAELWSIDKQAFRQVVSEAMRVKLAHSLKMQNTDLNLKSLKHVRLIGAGSFGSVRIVEHKRSAVKYAMKRIKKEDSLVPEDVARECNILSEVEHPFIVRMVKTLETVGSIYILTELITGGQLHEQVLAKMGVLTRKQAQFYIGSLVLNLEYLHSRNIVYRDLKPENVMLDMQGYLKLVDFGLAKKLEETASRTFTTVGTPFYMAPEVIKGTGYAFECDIWSLGTMLFEMVCGVVPFGAEACEPLEVFAEIGECSVEFPGRYNDQAGKNLILGMLQRDVDRRLGIGPGGWEDIKRHKYFKAGVSGDLFGKLMGRELTPPWEPSAEHYSDEQELSYVTQSDSEVLGTDEPIDVGCRILATFKRFDENRDGKIDRQELTSILTQLDAATFTPEVIQAMLTAADQDQDGMIGYEEFIKWMIGDNGGALSDAFKRLAPLDSRE